MLLDVTAVDYLLGGNARRRRITWCRFEQTPVRLKVPVPADDPLTIDTLSISERRGLGRTRKCSASNLKTLDCGVS